MEVRLGYNPSLQCLQNFNQPRAQLESELSKETQKLEHKYNDSNNDRSKWQGGMKRNRQEWPRKATVPSKKYSQSNSLAESAKLLP